MVSKKDQFDQVIRAKMAMFISLLYLIVKFFAQHLLRTRNISEVTVSDTKEEDKEPEIIISDDEEEYTSNLCFKFEYQIPKFNIVTNEEPTIIQDTFSDKVIEEEDIEEVEGKSIVEYIEFTPLETEQIISERSDNFSSSNALKKSFKELKEVILLKNFAEEIWGEKDVSVSQGFSGFDSDSDTTTSSDGYSIKNLGLDCDSDGFLSEKFFGEEDSLLNEIWSENSSNELELELKELNPREVVLEFIDSSEEEEEIPSTKDEEIPEQKQEEENNQEEDELDTLWEHQDLIEQLKMELKKARAVGLPTIMEESEKEMEDIKPWKINEKFLREEDPMDELRKFYNSYKERMRKFDILNYQKMYTIGFLKLKTPFESMCSHKPVINTILSHIRRKSSMNTTESFIRELQVELETVYVGQTCLSWEFLRWQYEKVRELPELDSYRTRRYNQVAGEFQQFQVIMRRFIENEPFQGPRLPNYVKTRCVLRNLLQVPVTREDKMEERKKGGDAITSLMLEDIMEESIRLFWDFVKADNKDENSAILKTLIGNQSELQDPLDYSLFTEIQSTLQKKDKKLKDILKTGNCLVKKFKKPKEDRSNQDLFFSQVDMKLVSRVLKMSRITSDQLDWCSRKLEKISIVERKVIREPSFLLFPVSYQ